jgi:hypothetical protein
VIGEIKDVQTHPEDHQNKAIHDRFAGPLVVSEEETRSRMR